ncbi:hypothetical protein SLS62_011342 [Diatrype stigma]|uniref:Xylanolytic transcriptional activator regulatory domain-containing protein n=1 Tax=Diatrype stigma TaxID=117547 RepID=A0AAN9U4R0_9PEZI
MVTLYFQAFESTYRILHIPSFWAEYHNYWDRPESVTTKLRLKILLVIAIGSSLSDHGDTNAGFCNMVHQWIYAAQTWLSGPLEKDRLDITGLQIHCLAIIARQIFAVGGDLVWISMGSLVHSAMQIGLHRDPKHLPAMSILQIELRRRLWATILEMAVQASLDTGMPPRISFDEFDTEPPSNNNDEEIDESTAVLQPQPKGTFTTTSIQLILLDSLPTRLRILKLLSSLKSEISYQDVLALSSNITDAYRAYSTFMRENEGSSSGGGGGGVMTPFHRNLLDYLVRRILIPLHCPFAGKARANPLFYYSLKASVDVALALIAPEPDAGFARLMARGVLLREGIRYASSVLSLELLAEASASAQRGAARRPSLYRKMLVQAVRDMLALAEERVRRGETNVKNHMFLSMILAQAGAVEEGGVGVERRIAQSGRDSLEFCHGLLQTWLATVALSSPGPSDAALTSINTTSSFDSGQDGNGLYVDWDYFFPDKIFS